MFYYNFLFYKLMVGFCDYFSYIGVNGLELEVIVDWIYKVLIEVVLCLCYVVVFQCFVNWILFKFLLEKWIDCMIVKCIGIVEDQSVIVFVWKYISLFVKGECYV